MVSEADKLRPLLAEGADPHVLAGLITMAEQHGPSGCRMLRDALVAKYGREGVLQDQQTMGKSFIRLSQPTDTGAGTFEYRLTLDVEGKSILEAALGPLSAPKPTDGERDLRTSDRRRGDALVTLVRRAVAAGDEVGKTNKTTLLLTMSFDDLKDRLGAATTLGGLDAGTHLAPETVRRLCCDGSVIPIVLGSEQRGHGLGPGETVLHRGPDQTALAEGRGLHLPGLRCAAAVDGRPSPRALGRPRPLRPVERGVAVRAAPHDRAQPPRTRAALSRMLSASTWSGTSPAAPTTSSSPDGRRRNQRDPAPHPADTGGVTAMFCESRAVYEPVVGGAVASVTSGSVR